MSMHEVKMTNIAIVRWVFYVVSILFHVVFIFTSAGNYFHGGTPVEFIAMQGVGLVIFMVAIKIFPQVKFQEKIAIVLCAIGPLFFLIASLVSPFFDA